MSLPLVISTRKRAIQLKQCVQYEQEAFLNESQFIINAMKPKVTKSCLGKGSKMVKKKRKNKSKSNQSNKPSVLLRDCETALNIYSISKGKKKSNQVSKNLQNLANSQELHHSPSLVYCTVRNLISSYSSKNCPPKAKSTSLTTSSVERTQTNSAKHGNSRQIISELKTKRQSCPPPILRSMPLMRKEAKVRKVYYSEAQSHMLAGVPCAPPVSPINGVLIAFEVVPSMADIKSQQTMKTKLRNLEIARQKENDKLRAQFLKEEKIREKEEREIVKQQRRAEIYALNEVMTQLERKKFLKFIKETNNGTTTISLKV